jgi:peptidoglycan/LPS O-acetylase OafA/YrhL
MRGESVQGGATRESGVPGKVSGRIPELDGLRGIAIGMVLVWHYFVLAISPAPATPLSYVRVFGRLTWTGVDLFFVLSGFLIGGILLDARGSANYFRVFYTRRFFRIVPIYVVLLIASPALVYAAQRVGHGDFSWLTANALPWYTYWIFAQNFWMPYAATLGANTLAITWSLAIEEQFYLTLPVVVRFFSGRRLLACVLIGICLAPVLRTVIRIFWPHYAYGIFTLMPCRADALLLGVLAAMLLREPAWKTRIQRARLYFSFAMPGLLLGIAYLDWKSSNAGSPLMQSVGHTWLALFYVNVLLFVLTRPASLVSRALHAKWLAWLGGIAYGTYLLHQLVQGLLFGYLWGHEPQITGVPTLLTAVGALALTLLIARLSWRFFEQPLIRFGHQSSYQFAEPESNELSRSAPELVRS